MVKRILIALLALAALILAGLLAYPFVEIDTGEKLIRCSYSDDFSAYDRNHS